MMRTAKSILIHWFYFSVVIFLLYSCGNDNKTGREDTFLEGTFGYDLNFLSKYQENLILQKDSSMLVICPAYQGRVMTSSSNGKNGHSYGWLNYELIKSGEILDHFNPVGGEDRFWLGPEGGQYSIFFAPGSEFTLDDWQTPPPIDTEPFDLISHNGTTALFEKEFQLKNYSGNTFNIKVQREVSLLSKASLTNKVPLPDDLNFVAYQSKNTITNIGNNTWNRSTGALSIWILGMFTPSENTTVMVPFIQGEEKNLGPIVNDAYFGKVPEERLKITDGLIFFKADGKYRSKIGLSPSRAKSFMGSYDEDNGVLTIVFYSKPDGMNEYVNSLWEMQEQPFAGDVANSYNDGPVNGSMLGPFYELESSSPAAFLEPDESLTHVHQTIHIEGNENELNQIISDLFHTDLQTIKSVF